MFFKVALNIEIALPRLAADALSGLAKGRTKINMEITGLDEPLEKTGKFVKNIVLAVIASIMFIGGCVLAGVNLEPKPQRECLYLQLS